jgi:hypothetical protein
MSLMTPEASSEAVTPGQAFFTTADLSCIDPNPSTITVSPSARTLPTATRTATTAASAGGTEPRSFVGKPRALRCCSR